MFIFNTHNALKFMGTGLVLGASCHFTWDWFYARPIQTQIQQVTTTAQLPLARTDMPDFGSLKPLPAHPDTSKRTQETKTSKPMSAAEHYQKNTQQQATQSKETSSAQEPLLDEALLQELVQEGLSQLNNPNTTLDAPEPIAVQTPNIYELPYELQARVPAFVYNSHTYSNEAEKRFVILSQKLFHEGDEIIPGLHITRIENQNLILTMGSYTFTVAAMEDWNGV